MASKLGLDRKDRIRWGALLLALAAALALIFFENQSFYRDFQAYFSGASPAADEPRSSRLTIEFGDGTRRAFEGEVDTGMTVLAALRAAENAGHFTAATDERGHILSIAGVKEDGQRAWKTYLNQKPASDVPGNIELKPGDRIVLKYE